MSEKEWEREKAVNLHLYLMQIYVQSVGICVSPGDPPPTACPADTHRKMPVSIPGEETPLKSSSVPGETLGKRLPHWGKSKESQGELARASWVVREDGQGLVWIQVLRGLRFIPG